MTRRGLLIALVAGAVVLGGGMAVALATGDDAAPAANTTQASTSVTAPKDSVRRTCEEFIGDGGPTTLISRVGDVLSDVGPEIDGPMINRLTTLNSELSVLVLRADSEAAEHLRVIQIPFKQAADAVRAGGGTLRLETGAARDGVLALTTTCAEAGYKVND